MRRKILLFIFCGVLSACDTVKPANPVCRISDQHLDDATGNAGCFIRVNEKLLTLGNIQTGRLDVPGGTADEGELAQCTAHRETFEETGFNVEVGKLLGIAENGFRIYQCQLADEVGEDIDRFPVPDWTKHEVAFIKLTDPFDTLASEWRYPKRHIETLDMFNKTRPENDEAENVKDN
ncbi:NUDIX domain-containing protein [Planctobacterium marinum]|uniref:NUDIX domain-containing protein n=1 Tax=Planctobacterium marinum TaxID=1631968 RepID=UPI001E45E74F|nr:NUDIX domain-containing protein [Planctobacterium marinum]MCC2604958.1 NUDIX domain-containing protein [Planctobacterium marinum]